MYVYVYSRFGIKTRAECKSIDDAVLRASYDIDNNTAGPIRIEDDAGNIVIDTKELLSKAWDLIEQRDLEELQK